MIYVFCFVFLIAFIVTVQFDGVLGFMMFFGLGVATVIYNSDTLEENKKQREAEQEKAKIPHVTREADGCKVYAFDANNSTHYFTRCPDSTTVTERNYSTSCGKTSCSKKEVINASN